MNLTQSILDLNIWHQRVTDIHILNSELLERLHSIECGIRSRHGKGHKKSKLYMRGVQLLLVC